MDWRGWLWIEGGLDNDVSMCFRGMALRNLLLVDLARMTSFLFQERGFEEFRLELLYLYTSLQEVL
jgi:hypothetical protein